MKTFALIFCLVLICCAASAATYSNANLNGTYTFQFSQPSYDVWSKTFSCPTNPNVTFTASGATTTSVVSYGTATFDGIGGITVSSTHTGDFDQTASANTLGVTWNGSCQVVSVNSGMIVYQAATHQMQGGTYGVQPNGSGSITLVGSGQGVIFQLGATDSSGTSNTLLLSNPAVKGNNIGTGIAVHQ